MKTLIGLLALVFVLGLPALAQVQRMTSDDEAAFNGYYSRWQQDKQTDNRDDMISMEHHMQDLMSKYSIPSNTPYDQVASQNGAPYNGYGDQDRDRGYANQDRDRGYANQGQNQLSPDDQNKFNKEYTKWQESNARNDRDDIDKHARNMEEIMSRYNIPQNTPFEQIATVGAYGSHMDVRQYQGRLSPDDQKKFDKSYEKWQRDRAGHDRDDISKDEGRMQEIMAKYNIPRNVPYDVLASGNRGY